MIANLDKISDDSLPTVIRGVRGTLQVVEAKLKPFKASDAKLYPVVRKLLAQRLQLREDLTALKIEAEKRIAMRKIEEARVSALAVAAVKAELERIDTIRPTASLHIVEPFCDHTSQTTHLMGPHGHEYAIVREQED